MRRTARRYGGVEPRVRVACEEGENVPLFKVKPIDGMIYEEELRGFLRMVMYGA